MISIVHLNASCNTRRKQQRARCSNLNPKVPRFSVSVPWWLLHIPLYNLKGFICFLPIEEAQPVGSASQNYYSVKNPWKHCSKIGKLGLSGYSVWPPCPSVGITLYIYSIYSTLPHNSPEGLSSNRAWRKVS